MAFTDPYACVPRWCWDWRTDPEPDGGKPCEPAAAGCQIAGRLCTAQELAAGIGCDAGFAPHPDDPGRCIPAGSFPGSGVPEDWDGDLATLPPVPPLQDSIPNGVPPLAPLPDVEDTFFCVDAATGQTRFCSAEELHVCTRGPGGELPDPKKCAYVGVPWPSRYCPPGFVVDGQAQVEAGKLPPCKPDPADCATGQEYAGAGPEDADVFVHGGKGNDGWPGTLAKPVSTIGKGLALAPAGGVVVVAPGTYVESVVISKAVSLRGHCAAMVRVVGVAGKAAVRVKGVAAAGAEAYVSGLQAGGPWYGVEVTGTLAARLERLFVAEATVSGLLVHGSGAAVQMASVVVAGTRSQPGGKDFGLGVSVEGGGELTLQDARVSGNRAVGLSVHGAGTALTATRLLVDGTLAQESDKTDGRGVYVGGGAQVMLQDARLSGNRQVGLFVSGAGTALTATRLLLDGTMPQESDKKFGRGVTVQNDVLVTLQDARLSGNRGLGLFVSGAGAALTAARLLIDGTLPQESDKTGGRGVSVQESAEVTLQDARLSGNRDTGLIVDGAGAAVSATRLLIDGTWPQESDDKHGRGVVVQKGAQVTLQDARLSSNRELGLFADGAGTAHSATRLLVDGTLPQESGKAGGRGVSVQDGARLRLQGARVADSRDAGLCALDASYYIAGVTIEATAPEQAHSRGGSGAWLVGGAGSLVASLLRANQAAALAVDHSTLQVRGCAIVATEWGTYPGVNGQYTGKTITLADGILLNAAPNSVIDRTLLTGNARAGILIEASPNLQVTRTLIDGRNQSLYGLVLQHSKDVIENLNAIFASTLQNRASDAGLAIPAPPEPAPQSEAAEPASP